MGGVAPMEESMSKSNTTENDVLAMVLKGTDPSWRSNANLWVALYTATPDEAGSAVTNEATYTSYGRVQLTKSSAWTDGGSSFSNAAAIQFLKCTGGSNTVTHFALVTTASGAGQVLYYGALSSPLAISNNIQPQFGIGELVVTED
jgi:hypothetical protein